LVEAAFRTLPLYNIQLVPPWSEVTMKPEAKGLFDNLKNLLF